MENLRDKEKRTKVYEDSKRSKNEDESMKKNEKGKARRQYKLQAVKEREKSLSERSSCAVEGLKGAVEKEGRCCWKKT